MSMLYILVAVFHNVFLGVVKFLFSFLFQVKARGAFVIVVTNSVSVAHNKSIADRSLIIRHDGVLSALLSVLPLQLISYEVALLRGNDPDRPRHLAKCVTVD